MRIHGNSVTFEQLGVEPSAMSRSPEFEWCAMLLQSKHEHKRSCGELWYDEIQRVR